MTSKCFYVFITLLFLAPYANATDPPGNVLVYATYVGGNGYDQYMFDSTLVGVLYERGYNATVTDRTETTEITALLLENYDQLWFFSTQEGPSVELAPEEINAILAFQSQGKGLFIAAENAPHYTYTANLVACSLGVTFWGIVDHAEGDAGGIIIFPEFEDHPLFCGVSQISAYRNECDMSVVPPADVVATYNGHNLIAVRDAGAGRCVFDVSFVRAFDGQIMRGDNAQYYGNIADWLQFCVPSITMISPDPTYVYWAFAMIPMVEKVYIGDFGCGYTASDINPWSVLLNGSVSPVDFEILPGMEGFTGEVMELHYPLADFIWTYPVLYDTTLQEYGVAGMFTDGHTFAASGDVTIIGKNSRATRNVYLKPDNDEISIKPSEFALYQNQPNPFNPTTEISFNLPVMSNVRLDVYNITGQKVTTLVDGPMQPGPHSVTWNGMSDSGEPVASGIYFYRIEAGNHSENRKMLLLK